MWTLPTKTANLQRITYKRQGLADMKRMNELKGRLQYPTTMTSENKHLQYQGIKISFLVYVMPVIIMVIKL